MELGWVHTSSQCTPSFEAQQRMHRALEVQEILLNIFGHCHTPHDLSTLARTCRTFNAPALDVLWEELHGLTPLATCLSEASHRLNELHSFTSRPLTQAEWDILLNRTRRVRSLELFRQIGVDEKSVKIFSNAPEPLFPNLRRLSCNYTDITRPLLLAPFPHLNGLNVQFENPQSFLSSLDVFPKFSPHLRTLCICINRFEDAFELIKAGPNYFCRWDNLQTVVFPDISLDANALVRLSRMPALTQLTFMVSNTRPHQINLSGAPLAFSNLRTLSLSSASLDPVSKLLSRMRLPAIKDLFVVIKRGTSKQDLSSFFARLDTSCNSHTLQGLHLSQTFSPDDMPGDHTFAFGLDVLHPCMAFGNLRRLHITIDASVELADADLLSMATLWPQLEQYQINDEFGWRTPGITPNGVLQFLQTCPLLRLVSLAVDTRGYVAFVPPPTQTAESTPSRLFFLDVLDSAIEESSVPAVAAFLAHVLPGNLFLLRAWVGLGMRCPPDTWMFRDRWKAAYREAGNIFIGSRS